jgi:tRNA-specific 2-thiouridylase
MLDIPYYVMNFRSEFKCAVIDYFVAEYKAGRTPNPCIACNRYVKWESLYSRAKAIGADCIATGHYSQIVKLPNGRYALKKSVTDAKDQTYALYNLTQEQLAGTMMPVGEYSKDEIRAIAEEIGLLVANKPDSMEICFIPDKDYIGWLSQRMQMPGPGKVTLNGETVMTHEGIHRWTVGQRLPGLFNERKLYVTAIRPETDEIIAALWEDLFKTEVRARDMNWLIDTPTEPIRGSVRVRHTKWENPDCTVTAEGSGAVILCDDPVRAPARGQAAVLYDGDRVIGGGWII